MNSRPILFAAALAAVVFIIEWLIMLFLVPIVSPHSAAAIDAVILVLCVAPAIYLLLYRPLRAANTNLERRVVERTALLGSSETKYRNLVENLGPGLFFYRHDVAGVFEFVSPSIKEMLGYESPEFLKHYTSYLTDDPINREAENRTLGTLRGERQSPYEISIFHKDGSIRLLEVTEVPIKNEAGHVVAVEGFAFDITARKSSELDARQAVGLQTVINQLQSLSLEEISLDEILSRALKIILSIPGLSMEPRGAIFLTESPDHLHMHAEQGLSIEIQRKCASVKIGHCLCGKAVQMGEIQHSAHIDGRHEIHCDQMCDHGHYCIPLAYAGKSLGVINCYLGADHVRNAFEEESLKIMARTIAGMIVRKKSDIEKEQLREQYRQSQRMETIGTLAGGVAHDFNNILAALASAAEDARIVTTSLLGAPLPHFQEMDLSIQRAAGLTRQLLAFSRKQLLRPEATDLNELVLNLGKMIGRLIGEQIEMDVRLDRQLNSISADTGQIEQAIINICVNARDAMPKGGRLTLETRNIVMDDHAPHGLFEVPAGRYVLLEITDTGFGMDRKTADRVFEPFFTTKELGSGTGLGLSTVYGIIKQHNGYIYCYSEPGKGTAFKIFLPAGVAKPEEIAPIPVAAIEGGAETILVAEDQEAVARGVRRTLERLGYTIILARDGREAVETFRKEHDRIDLVMLDAVMPNMGGKEASEQIAALNPGQRFLFTSGYAADVGIADDALSLPAGMHFIQKPYSGADLAGAVRRALEGEP